MEKQDRKSETSGSGDSKSDEAARRVKMRKIRWGIAGTGKIAVNRVIPGILGASNAELVAAMSVRAEAVEKVCREYHVEYAYTDYEEMLKNENVDAVYIASPVNFHVQQMECAALYGKHILVEKPLSFHAPETEHAIEVCRNLGIKAAAGFMMRYHELHREMRRLIAEGVIGEVTGGYVNMSFWYPEDGSWRQSKKTGGGGAFMDVGVHCTDLIHYVTGENTSGITALCGNRVFSYDVEDSVALTLKLESGALFQVQNYFCTRALPSVFQVYGTRGTLCATGTLGQTQAGELRLLVAEADGSIHSTEHEAQSGESLYTLEVESLSRSILEATAEEVPVEAGLLVQKVADAVYQSSETGKYVMI